MLSVLEPKKDGDVGGAKKENCKHCFRFIVRTRVRVSSLGIRGGQLSQLSAEIQRSSASRSNQSATQSD